MVPDDDLGWTTVVGRRASKLQSSSPSSTRHLQFSTSSRSRSRQKAPPSPLNRGSAAFVKEEDEDHDDETRILLRMKRSMSRVQESEFFKRFLDQLQSPQVLDNLRRAAAPPPNACATLSAQNLTAVTTPAYRGNCNRLGEGKIVSEDDVNGVCHACARGAQGTASGGPSIENFADELTFRIRKTTFNTRIGGISADRDSEGEKCVGLKGGNESQNGPFTDGPESGQRTEAGQKERLGNATSDEQWQLQIVVYGLGKIADSEVSRCQFSLVLLLKQSFPWVGDIEVYDPVLSHSECKVIQVLGCSPIAINEEGRRSINRPTVFYMPHCEDWLYDNVLQANWTPQKLNQMIILGNSFRSYQERWSSFLGARSKPPPTYVLELQENAQEIPLEATSSLELPVFNNMSWHFFPEVSGRSLGGCAT